MSDDCDCREVKHVDGCRNHPDNGKHALDEDSCCIRCGFDAAEWWHLEKQKPKESREPQPQCSQSDRSADGG